MTAAASSKLFVKPWMIPAARWKTVTDPPLDIAKLATTLQCAIAVAKPSENLYIGKPIGKLSSVDSAVVNVMSHGEMAIERIIDGGCDSVDTSAPLPASALTALLPRGSKKLRLLNHFGYRKNALVLYQPDSLPDHAWIACALSYGANTTTIDVWQCSSIFDQKGGTAAGGVAGITRDGGIFRGSGIVDLDGTQLVSPMEGLEVSLAANGLELRDIMEIEDCTTTQKFTAHPYYVDLLRRLSLT